MENFIFCAVRDAKLVWIIENLSNKLLNYVLLVILLKKKLMRKIYLLFFTIFKKDRNSQNEQDLK